MQRTRIVLGCLLMVMVVVQGNAETIDVDQAARIARRFVAERSSEHDIRDHFDLCNARGRVVLHAFTLAPAGFILVSADSELPPVLGYSPRNPFLLQGPAHDQVVALLVADVEQRLSQAPRLPDAQRAQRQREWQRLLEGTTIRRGLSYWPRSGTTTTGGWIETQWHQGSPYNADCPLDPMTLNRSVAGCPAVAMAQVINYFRTTNTTRLDDGDDYHHSYSGRTFWIDDDWAANGFPSFPSLGASLDTLDARYGDGLSADDSGAAALVFACGVAAEQVYTSSVSGTFGVAQAVQGYLRFGFDTIELLTESDTDLYPRMEHDVKTGHPVHLAVVDPGWTTGHNVVVDGYCSDGTFHLNFGWGGPYDGWYLLPDEMPYGLTVVEGAIIEIEAPLFASAFESGGLADWTVAP